jgi:hypothetical protein
VAAEVAADGGTIEPGIYLLEQGSGSGSGLMLARTSSAVIVESVTVPSRTSSAVRVESIAVPSPAPQEQQREQQQQHQESSPHDTSPPRPEGEESLGDDGNTNNTNNAAAAAVMAESMVGAVHIALNWHTACGCERFQPLHLKRDLVVSHKCCV